MTVVVADRAKLELAEATAWYEEKNEGTGVRFYGAVRARLAALPTMKLRKLKRSNLNVYFVEVGKPWPYRILVRKRDDVLEVVAFAHHRRDDDYWSR